MVDHCLNIVALFGHLCLLLLLMNWNLYNVIFARDSICCRDGHGSGRLAGRVGSRVRVKTDLAGRVGSGQNF